MKKAFQYILDKDKRAIWLRAFRMWQRRPYKVAPLSAITHTCASCQTVFEGNYCPRCGQSAAIGRFSFKKAILLFMDVWGMGNRGMFRTIRDLMLRPGYMIRDYLSGMQSAYFPPFKMFFLLTAFSLVVEHGLSFDFNVNENHAEEAKSEIVVQKEGNQQKMQSHQTAADGQINNDHVKKNILLFVKWVSWLQEKNPAIFSLLLLLLFSAPLYFFFRSSPNIPDLTYPEFFVALVYTSNAYSLYSILGNLLGTDILVIIAFLMIFVALKQFSGFTMKRLLGYTTLSILVWLIVIIMISILVIYVGSY